MASPHTGQRRQAPCGSCRNAPAAVVGGLGAGQPPLVRGEQKVRPPLPRLLAGRPGPPRRLPRSSASARHPWILVAHSGSDAGPRPLPVPQIAPPPRATTRSDRQPNRPALAAACSWRPVRCGDSVVEARGGLREGWAGAPPCGMPLCQGQAGRLRSRGLRPGPCSCWRGRAGGNWARPPRAAARTCQQVNRAPPTCCRRPRRPPGGAARTADTS